MRKLTLHVRIEIGLAVALLLSSCSDGGGDTHSVAEAYDLADVARANSVNALYTVQQLEERVSEIEARLNM
jgi:hypothetical protein